MNEKALQTNPIKVPYTKPELKELGKLCTLIQGKSGKQRDNWPATGTKP